MTDPIEPKTKPSEMTPLGAQQTQTADTHAGQRRVNLIWETTQATIAISVTITVLFVAGSLAVGSDVSAKMTAFVFLSNAFSIVIGFYFGRTNHQAIGGVGVKPTEPPYQGR